MRFFYGFLTAIVVMGLGGLLFMYSGVYNIAASDDHLPMTTWALHTTMHQSVEAQAEDVEVPENLVTEERVRQGARAYDQLCAACHLKPGQSESLIRQGLSPTPPTLAREGHWSAGEQFWIIKHGIRMTGMPAWGPTHEDEDLWEITAFLQRLPSLSETQYADLVEPEATVAQEADDGHDHEHTDMSGMTMMSRDDSSAGMSMHSGEDGHHGDGGHETEGSDHHGDEASHSDTAEPETTDSTSKAQDDHYADGHTH